LEDVFRTDGCGGSADEEEDAEDDSAHRWG